MATIIEAKDLCKRFGNHTALDHVSFTVQSGTIVGLIGRNGAGKTTALKALLGLTPYQGSISVLGRDPSRERTAMMGDICFIADTAVLPRWLRVEQAIDYVAGMHPRFRRERAQQFLSRTSIRPRNRIGTLSKGMITQVHLALILAIDARLLVLDEPTLGLDLLYRRQFYDTLLCDYFDSERTIVLTTHQVEEVENLLTHVLFIEGGQVVLDAGMETLAERYVQVNVASDQIAAARAQSPFYEREIFGRQTMLFENRPRELLAQFGELRTPSISDLFVAKMQGVST
jgi:ABC-2 type transport system ATP-binding protein